MVTRARLREDGWTQPALLVTIVIALVSLLLSGFASYTTNDKQNEHRVTVVETKVEGVEKRLDRIEDKLDALMRLFGMTPRPRPQQP